MNPISDSNVVSMLKADVDSMYGFNIFTVEKNFILNENTTLIPYQILMLFQCIMSTFFLYQGQTLIGC